MIETSALIRPSFPIGATSCSIYSAAFLLSGQSDLASLAGLPKKFVNLPSDLFGFFANRVDGACSSGNPLPRSHLTLADFFCSPFDAAQKSDFQQMMRSMDHGKLKHHFKLSKHSRLIKRRMNLCPVCVKEDENLFGIGFWRNVHQLSTVSHCPTHLRLLVLKCAECDSSPFRWQALQPPKYCPHLESTSDSAEETLSSTYKWFLAACNTIAEGVTDLVRPDHRQKIYEQALEATGAVDKHDQIDLLTRKIKHHWGLKPGYDFNDEFEISDPERSVIWHALENRTVPNVVAHLVVLAAILCSSRPALS